MTSISNGSRHTNIVVMPRKEPSKLGRIILFLASPPPTHLFLSMHGIVSFHNVISPSIFSDLHDVNRNFPPMPAFLEILISTALHLQSPVPRSSFTILLHNEPLLPLMALWATTSVLPWNTTVVIRYSSLPLKLHVTARPWNGSHTPSPFLASLRPTTSDKQQRTCYASYSHRITTSIRLYNTVLLSTMTTEILLLF